MTLPPLVEATRSAHWGWDEHRYFGHRVFAELTGQESWTGLMALSILGRRLPPDCCAVLDDAVGALTLADPRIWPLKLTRVVASYGAMIPALGAGVLMENEARIGPWAFLEAARVLRELHEKLDGDPNDATRVQRVVDGYLVEHPFIWGFGTPFRGRDERLVAFRTCMERRGKNRLPYYRTMEAVATAVKQAKHAEPNIGVALAAVLLDMELTPGQIGALVVAMMQHMFFAHAVEGAADAAHGLRELRPAYVSYRGRERRTSPRAQQAEVARHQPPRL